MVQRAEGPTYTSMGRSPMFAEEKNRGL